MCGVQQLLECVGGMGLGVGEIADLECRRDTEHSRLAEEALSECMASAYAMSGA